MIVEKFFAYYCMINVYFGLKNQTEHKMEEEIFLVYRRMSVIVTMENETK